MRRVEVTALQLRPFEVLDRRWALLVSGVERPNPMTVSWGGFGTLWHRPVVTVYVRPTRFSHDLLRQEAAFTLSVLPEALRPALERCGASSGRDVDKWAVTGLHAAASETVRVPRVAEAELAFECRVLASLELDPGRFLEPTIERLYPARDFHTVFLGEVLAAWQAEAADGVGAGSSAPSAA